MKLDEWKDLIKYSIDYAKSVGTSVVLSLHITDMAGNVEDSIPTPPAQNRVKYKVQTDKPNGRVKVRTSPSPSVDGPTVTEGTIVFGTGNKESRYETLWIEIETDSYLRGWVEDFNLVSVK